MIKITLRKTFVISICYALVCSPMINAEQIYLPFGDLFEAKISQLKHTVTDGAVVKQVAFYYRVIGAGNTSEKIQNTTKIDYYQVTIKADEVRSPGIDIIYRRWIL